MVDPRVVGKKYSDDVFLCIVLISSRAGFGASVFTCDAPPLECLHCCASWTSQMSKLRGASNQQHLILQKSSNNPFYHLSTSSSLIFNPSCIIPLHRKLQSTVPQAPPSSIQLPHPSTLSARALPPATSPIPSYHSSSHFSRSRERAHDTPQSYHTMASLSLHSALRSAPRAASRAFAVPKVVQLTARRHKSGPYGYTQAKALVYSTYGEPKDVLE